MALVDLFKLVQRFEGMEQQVQLAADAHEALRLECDTKVAVVEARLQEALGKFSVLRGALDKHAYSSEGVFSKTARVVELLWTHVGDLERRVQSAEASSKELPDKLMVLWSALDMHVSGFDDALVSMSTVAERLASCVSVIESAWKLEQHIRFDEPFAFSRGRSPGDAIDCTVTLCGLKAVPSLNGRFGLVESY